jgi:hypothetical protein
MVLSHTAVDSQVVEFNGQTFRPFHPHDGDFGVVHREENDQRNGMQQ